VSHYRYKYGNIGCHYGNITDIVANEMDDINIPSNIMSFGDDFRSGFIKQRLSNTISLEKWRSGWTAVGQMTRTNWLPTLLFLFLRQSLRFCLFAHPPWSTRGEAEFRNERITADSQRASIINKRVPEPNGCPLERCESSYKKVIGISNIRY